MPVLLEYIVKIMIVAMTIACAKFGYELYKTLKEK